MSNDTDKLIARIDVMSHRFVRIYEQQIENKFIRMKNLSKTEISVLSILCADPQKIMRDLSDDLHIKKSTLTGVIDHLETRGYLRRVISTRDRRSFGLEVTEEGRLAQLEHIKYERASYLEIITALRASGDVEVYLDLTEKILDYLEHSHK